MKPVIFEPTARRVRVIFNGETIADTTAGRLLIESAVPLYYFPISDVRLEFLRASTTPLQDARKGAGRYWSVVVGDRVGEDAAWQFDAPAEIPELAGYISFVWTSMDRWMEEDEEIFKHARNPYKRVDAVRSSRHVEVMLGGIKIADSTRAVFLFETGMPTRYYFPMNDVRQELLVPSDLFSTCPYKGQAHYYHVAIGERLHENVVWYYPDPIPECPRIKGMLAFWNEFVDAIIVDGRTEAKSVTEFSNLPLTERSLGNAAPIPA